MEIKNEKNCTDYLSKLIDIFHDPLLTDDQKKLYKMYFQLLIEMNELHNLTAITNPKKIISDHLRDSLAITRYIDFQTIPGCVDVGSGAGFPGIPLKIYKPELFMVLIEVNKKKIIFLEKVISQLNLKKIIVYPYDWRTFLRKTKFDVTVFLSRASLHPEELLRVFRANSPYRDSLLVYYASEQWKPSAREESFIINHISYPIDNKIRTLVLFKNIPEIIEKRNL